MKTKLYAGMDLHSNNVVVAHVNEQGKRLGHRKLPCQLAAVLEHLNQAQAQADGALVKLAVESTFNWYWLVDGLMEAGYQVCLANPAAMDQYSGRKWVNDTTDAYFIAELLRLASWRLAIFMIASTGACAIYCVAASCWSANAPR